jgi:hypothetical protein
MKKIIFAISAFFFAIFFAFPAMAQPIPLVYEEDLLKEPPLTQNDVEIYKKYYNFVYIWRTASDNKSKDKDEMDLEEYVFESDFTPTRINSILGKITDYIAVRNGEIKESEVKEWYSTNAEEKKLLDKNYADLKAIDDKIANLN